MGTNPSEGMGSSKSETEDESKKTDESSTNDSSLKTIEKMILGLTKVVTNLADRVESIETGGAKDFQKESSSADIEAANEMRQDIDPRICKIVDEVLGSDFGIRVDTKPDSPGMVLTLIVPNRLSDKPLQQRPVMGANGKYKKNTDKSTMFETYKPADERSKPLSTLASFETIRAHCVKVQANIVAYYQKMKKPLPAFNLKT